MPDHIANRDTILRALREELVGPCPIGAEIDCTAGIQLDDAEAAYRPYRQLGTGEEILQRDSPTKRYGVGVLYPMEAPIAPEELESQPPAPDDELGPESAGAAPEPLTASAIRDCEAIAARAEHRLPEADSDDFDLSSANAYKPSSMAVSLLVRLPEGAELVVDRHRRPLRHQTDHACWARARMVAPLTGSPMQPVPPRRFSRVACRIRSAREPVRENVDNFDVRIEVFARPYQSRPDEFLVTVCLINRQPVGRAIGFAVPLPVPDRCGIEGGSFRRGHDIAVSNSRATGQRRAFSGIALPG
jgi:hypothetical protein